MPWLCYIKHNWFFIDGEQRRTCLRCNRYERLSVWVSYATGNIESLWIQEFK